MQLLSGSVYLQLAFFSELEKKKRNSIEKDQGIRSALNSLKVPRLMLRYYRLLSISRQAF